MKPVDYVIIGVVLVIAAFAGWYIIRAKKKGKKCIGCPDCRCSGGCGNCSGQCGGK